MATWFAEGFARRAAGEGAGDLEDAGAAARIETAAGRRLIALLAVVREAATLFSAVPHLPLSDISHGVRQSYPHYLPR